MRSSKENLYTVGSSCNEFQYYFPTESYVDEKVKELTE